MQGSQDDRRRRDSCGGRILLVKYDDVGRYDGQKGWFLPDDFLEYAEHPDDAAKRIASEQTGLSLPKLALNHIESFGNGAWHLAFHYAAHLGAPRKVVPGKNVAAFEWFDLKRLPNASEVAHHGWGLDVIGRILKGRGR